MGAISSQRPSPVQRSWSIQTFMVVVPQGGSMGALTLPQRRINPATTGGMLRCRVAARHRSSDRGGGHRQRAGRAGRAAGARPHPRGGGPRAAAPAPGRAQARAHAGGAAARDQGPAQPGGVAEREAHLHPAGGARPHRRAARGGRQAHPAAVGLRHPARPQRRRHRRRVHRRPQGAGGGAPRARATSRSTAARRSSSTSRSTWCWPAAPSSPARSSPSRSASTTPAP